jgi:hypothetical protein
MYKLKVHSEDPDNPEDTKQIINNPSVHGPQERYFPRHELMKVVETVRRSDKLAPFTNEEYEHRSEWASAKDAFVTLLKRLEEKKTKKGELVYPTQKIALSDPAITAWKKQFNVKVSLGVFVKTFRDLFQLVESYVILRKEARPVATIQRPRAQVSDLSAKQQELREKLMPFAKTLTELLTEPKRVSELKDWFEGVASFIKNQLKDRHSGITKLSKALELFPDKFELTENRTLVSRSV